ncbi:MAG: bifunctional 4-hydroxy-2-oxoglutarate aldolase/2-dehydro-3-deoxy-phosphogluconate aldolase [Candidatus Limnocylindrales bacterium]
MTDAVERLRRIGVVPVVEIPDVAAAIPLADTLLEAGIGAIEITFRTAAAAGALAAIRRERPDMLAGAGTVLRPEQLEAAVDADAQFVVTPGYSDGIVRRAIAAGVPVFPGVATASEVQLGLEAGLSVLKLYPAQLIGGVAYLKALGAPFPEMSFIPSGGIGAADLVRYLEQPNVVACGGSWFVNREWIASGDLGTIGKLAAEAAAIVRGVRRPPSG